MSTDETKLINKSQLLGLRDFQYLFPLFQVKFIIRYRPNEHEHHHHHDPLTSLRVPSCTNSSGVSASGVCSVAVVACPGGPRSVWRRKTGYGYQRHLQLKIRVRKSNSDFVVLLALLVRAVQ